MHEIVGQLGVLDQINTWKLRSSFPHFLLIVGPKGSGKKLFAELIAKNNATSLFTLHNYSVDSIRSIVRDAYSVDSRVTYLIPDADEMSSASRNALLKLTEEPPENAYVIITLLSLENTLPTLRSRSQHLVMSPYMESDIRKLTSDDTIYRVAETPGMVKVLEELGSDKVAELVSTCSKLLEFVGKISTSNALKSATKFAFKANDDGFDIDLFFPVMSKCIRDACESSSFLVNSRAWSRTLSKNRYLFYRSGVNKKSLYDKMILEVRELIQRGR